MVNQVFVAYPYIPSLTNRQIWPHRVVVACLVLLSLIEVRVVAPFDPHVELRVVPPVLAHQLTRHQVLFCLSFVHEKHEEKQFF